MPMNGHKGDRMRLVSGLSLTVAAALVLTAVGCGKMGELKARKNYKEANQAYAQQDYKRASELYELTIQADPDNPGLANAYFYLGNSYDNLYKPARKGEKENDAFLTKGLHSLKFGVGLGWVAPVVGRPGFLFGRRADESELFDPGDVVRIGAMQIRPRNFFLVGKPAEGPGGLLVVDVAQRDDVLHGTPVNVAQGFTSSADCSDVEFLVRRLVAQRTQRSSATESRGGHCGGQ